MNEIEAISVLETRIKYPNNDTYGGMCEAEYQQEAVVLAIEALREQAERESGCEFCCYQEYHDKTLYPKEGYVFYAGFSKQIDVDDFDEIETDEIKYCPMCGRRLEVEHETD